MNAQVANPTEEETQGRPVSIPEVRALLEKEQAGREELAYEQKLALEHAAVFTRIPPEKVDGLVEELRAVTKITEWHRRKIVDIAPTHADDVRAIFVKDRISLDDGEIEKILNAVRSVLG